MTFAFGVMTFRRCTHVYRLLAPGNISTKSQNKIQKRRNTKHEIHLHSDTLHNCMQLFDTPGKGNLHKVHCFFGFGKGFDLSLCYGTTHKLPFAVKIQIPITLRLRRRACKARERAQLFISWTRSRWCTWSSSESSKQISAHVYPC